MRDWIIFIIKVRYPVTMGGENERAGLWGSSVPGGLYGAGGTD